MKYTIVRLFLVAVTCAVSLPNNTASAGWGRLNGGGSSGGGSSGGLMGNGYGGYGSSGGGYVTSFGSSGGGYGSYSYGGSSGGGSSGGVAYGGGSSGGTGPGAVRRFFAHMHDKKLARRAQRASYGSSGGSSGGYYSSGYGSSGGSSGGYVTSYGSSGGYGSSGYSTSYGSTGGFGSSGGAYGSSYVVPGSYDAAPAAPQASGYLGVSNQSPAGAATLASHQGTSSDAIYLNVSVPAAAKVFVNDMATTSTGASRQFISRGLEAGKRYKFEIRAEVTAADGSVATETKTVSLGAGQREELDFASLAQTPVQTAVTINVPADARVVLAGNETSASGETRTFRTAQLKAGEQWDDYVIEVHHDGKVKRETLRLVAGDDVALTFNFDDDKSLVASR